MNKILLCMLTGLFFLPTACKQKKAQATKQTVETIDIPQYPSLEDGVYSLDSSVNSMGYGGTLVLLNQEAKPEDIATLLQASIDSRNAWGAFKKFTTDLNYNEVYGLQKPQELRELKQDLVDFTRNIKISNPPDDATLEHTAHNWWPTELNILYGEGDSPEKENGKALFGQYCDSKIWQLGVNSNFAVTSYYSRPTAMAFCESYYEEREYFTSADCEDSEEGKSYFNCIWRDGIAKTRLLELLPEATKTFFNDTLLIDGNIELFQRLLALDITAYANPGFGNAYKNSKFLSRIILTQESISSCAMAIPAPLKGICTALEVDMVELDVPLKMSINDSLVDFEGKAQNSLFPLVEGRSFAVDQILHLYGRRAPNHGNSESDRLYHKVAEGWELVAIDADSTIITEQIRLSIDNYFSQAGFLYPPLDPQNQAIFDKKQEAIEALEADITDKAAQSQEYVKQLRQTSLSGFQAGRIENLAHAMLVMQFKITNHDNILRAYFNLSNFAEKHVVVGCFNLSDPTSVVENCLEIPEEDSVSTESMTEAKLFRVNANTGLVEFEFDIENPEQMGFVMVERDEADNSAFSDLGSDYYQGKSLYLELFPNIIHDYMEILTGKGFIRVNGEDVEEAAISLWNQNL